MNFMTPRFGPGTPYGGMQYNPQQFAPRPAPGVQMPIGYGAPQQGMGMPLSGLRQPMMASYKNGTPYVPRTGPAMLHEGEMIVPAPKAKKIRKVALSSLLRLK
jgi:hypothetical protein